MFIVGWAIKLIKKRKKKTQNYATKAFEMKMCIKRTLVTLARESRRRQNFRWWTHLSICIFSNSKRIPILIIAWPKWNSGRKKSCKLIIELNNFIFVFSLLRLLNADCDAESQMMKKLRLIQKHAHKFVTRQMEPM